MRMNIYKSVYVGTTYVNLINKNFTQRFRRIILDFAFA